MRTGDVLTVAIVHYFGLKCTRDAHLCVNGSPGFLQLDDIEGQQDPHYRSMGGHHETLEGHNIQMLQNDS